MIDTIAYRCFLALLPEGQWLRGWKGWWPKGDDGVPFQRYERSLKHTLFGIRLFIRAGMVVKVEVDLPKLLYGHNGRLIKTQEELDRAFVRLKQALQTICQLVAPGHGFFPGELVGDTQTSYMRIDLVWQFDLVPTFTINALRHSKHPEINRPKGEWENQTLAFPGTKLRISIYDKKVQAKAKCPHNVLRVEVQLRDEKIDQHFQVAENNTPPHLTIPRAYAAYRSVLLGFGTIDGAAATEGGIEDFLAWVCTKLPDLDVVGQYAQMKPVKDRQLGGLRREVGKRVPQLLNFSWADLLPEAPLPPVVEIANEREELKINRLFEQLCATTSATTA